MTATYYKVTNADGSPCHGGKGRWSLPVKNPDGSWTPGKWRSVRGDLVACDNGLHAAKPETLIDWLGEAIWEIEFAGPVIDAGNKVLGRKARLVRGTAWNERTARHFAADCAEDALAFATDDIRPTLEVVIHTVRAYADGEATDEELSAAYSAALAAYSAVSAARSAAWSAAYSAALAAYSAARSAAWSAARSAALAARSAAWSAARSAARSAAWSAARSAALAARSAQNSRLLRLIEETPA